VNYRCETPNSGNGGEDPTHCTASSAARRSFHHPVADTLTLDWGTFPCGTDQTLGVWTVEPGTPCHDGLHILGSWKASSTADRDPDAGKLP
jgi:hypothetical protein